MKRAVRKKNRFKRRQNFMTKREILNGTLLQKIHLKVVEILSHPQEKMMKVNKMKWKKERVKYGTLIYPKER